jgi:predicted ATPase
MKRCPTCRRDYYDDSLRFCLDDGSALLEGPAASDTPTLILNTSVSAAVSHVALGEVDPAESFDRSVIIRSLLNSSELLVGRSAEIRDISDLIMNDDVRLLTLTGTGGTGKTMLAKEVGGRLSEEFPAGVIFVELESVNDPVMVGPAIAHALGFNETGTKTISELLFLKLQERAMLLILDNFEQVITAGVEMASLLRAAPRVKILVTSREPLKLSIEREYRVPPLSLPFFTKGDSVSNLMTFDAVQLFVERAKRARPDFELNDENASAVAKICSKLDGLPLALELAASRTRVLSPDEILDKLDDRLALLTGGSRDLPGRQQTMRAAIEWSFELLSEDERISLTRLAVFEGGFSFKAAETIASCKYDTLDLITALTEKSLLMSRQTKGGEVRFWMLQTVRDYALEMLVESGEHEQLRREHADLFLGFVQKASPNLRSFETATWLDRLETDNDNLRAALRWSIINEPQTAAEIAASMSEFWTMHGHIREAEHWLQKILENYHEKETLLRWEILTALGIIKQFRGDLSSALSVHMEALKIARGIDSKTHIGKSLRGIAAVEYIRSDFTAAREHTEEALAICRSIDDQFGAAAALARFGDLALAESDFEEASVRTAEALEIFRKLGYVQGVAAKLSNLGAVELLKGNHERAESILRESLESSLKIGDITIARLVIDGFAALKCLEGNFVSSARLSGYGAKLAGSLGIESEPAEVTLRESYMGTLLSSITKDDFSSAYADGEKMSLEEASRLALSGE